MTKVDILQYESKTPIGFYPMGLKGISILGIENGIDDFIIVRDINNKLRKLKIRYANGKDYFKLDGWRIYLEDCMRVHI